jgi:hypothetical protein
VALPRQRATIVIVRSRITRMLSRCPDFMCTCLYSSFSPTPPGSCRMSILFPIYHYLGCLKALLLTLSSTFPFSCFLRLHQRAQAPQSLFLILTFDELRNATSFPPDRNLLSLTRTRQRHVPVFPSPSFIVPLAKCSSVLAGSFDVAPRSAESPNLYLRPQVSHKRPDPASPF